MNSTSNISKFKQIATLLLGVFIAFIIGFGNDGYFTSTIEKTSVEQKNNEGSDTTEELVLISAVNAITVTVQLHITHVFYFISENILSNSSKVTENYLEMPHVETYLNMVFRQIISPNAP
ncbi:MAG: hypothetical protein OEX22_11155 [Cyclobacteriaceae bacterium]|nr:hypothetical protein [Cyclobacteriaceae bacterium]